ncbi:hypothetical protein [Senegalia massiliensis]|uniref:hypothetical protein n=1 Tax=Senegalia massiliensis TaxID=1720316 RepID=UPI00102FD65E|nr:hypothetical protein [Senegalia massiliensis]
MRNVKIGEKEYKLAGGPMTLYFYKKEFKEDLIGNLMKFSEMEEDPSKLDSIIVLQMAWAMHKTAKTGQLISFEQWMESLEYVDFEDPDMMLNIITEAQESFFRGGQGKVEQTK